MWQKCYTIMLMVQQSFFLVNRIPSPTRKSRKNAFSHQNHQNTYITMGRTSGSKDLAEAELADKAETPSSDTQSRLTAFKSLCDPDTGVLIKCRTELENLNTKLTTPEWIGPPGSKRRDLVQALTWPLKKGDTEKVLASIERFKSTINIAVTTDQTWVDVVPRHDVFKPRCRLLF